MRLDARQLNRATLARQLLIERRPLSVEDGIQHVVALQAQEPASPYIALWNRLAAFDPKHLDAAFAARKVVKAPLMRITLHAVHVDDYAAYHEAVLSTLRASRLNDRRFISSGLTTADADALIPHLTRFAAEPRSKEDVENMIAEQLGATPDRGVWWALRTYAPLVHAPEEAPWSFSRPPMYETAPPSSPSGGPARSLQTLFLRYLEAFGPASIPDFAQYTMQQRSKVRDATEAMPEVLTRLEGPDGTQLFDVPDAPIPDGDTPAPPRLLGMWDSVLLAYHDRSRIIPEGYRQHVARRNGDILPAILVDGYVAGVWRPVERGIEATAFHPLDDDTWAALNSEAQELTGLLADRDRDPYKRYNHWWRKLPTADTRLLDGRKPSLS